MQQKNIIIILIIIIVIALLAFGAYVAFPDMFESLIRPATEVKKQQPKVIEENLIIPDTQKIVGSEGRMVTEGAIDVPIVPKTEGEKVVVEKAVLTVRGSYDLATPEALKWASDAKLIFIKSLGAVTLEGKSSQWQLAFSAKSKSKKGYEIIIQADQIVSKKEIDSTAVGGDVPKIWKDLGEIVKELQSHPLYQDATVSAVNFYLNADNKKWYYALSTSKGVSSIVVE